MFYWDVFTNYFDRLNSFVADNSNMVLPAIATFSVAMLIIGKLYYRIRVNFPMKVNCWFCNSYTSVPYNTANSWYCPHCDQYNGFSSDGSYNRILTEQFNEKLNFGSWCSKSKQKSPNANGLCRFCNNNLELKVRQLAQFVPLNQANYDEEVKQYSDQLEKVYRLCPGCERVLEKTLAKKQELYFNHQQPFKTVLNHSITQMEAKQRHPVFVGITASLSVCMLLTAIPHSWLDQLIAAYPSADYFSQLIRTAPTTIPPYLIPSLGAGIQVIDCVCMRDATSLVNLFLWIILLSLPYVPVKVDGLFSVMQVLASVVFLITTVTESKRCKSRTVATVKPVQFQKLDAKLERPRTPKIPQAPTYVPNPQTNVPTPPTNVPTYVSDSAPPAPDPSLLHERTSEDFGFSKLNVSSRRVTRSQSKPFQAKNYTGTKQSEIFRPKPISLSPPKLQLDLPVTRSSSQSSGFVSLSHQKDFEEDQAASIINDNMESVSQYGGGMLSPYRSPFPSPVPFQQYGPFSQFQPYAVMHYAPPPFDKVYSYANMSFYEPSLNLSSSTIASHRTFENISWFQSVKNTLSSLLFVVLIISNIAILWKEFGVEYFKVKA